MAGIVGIDRSGKQEVVARMLDRIAHRGQAGSKRIENSGVTLGAVWPAAQAAPTPPTLRYQAAWDASQPPLPVPTALAQTREHFALAAATPDGVFLARDPLGVRPLYYGWTDDGALCFASEVKALLEATPAVREFPPGAWYDRQAGLQVFARVEPRPALDQEADQIAAGLRLRLDQAVCRRVHDDVLGCWLSGGLDSSAVAALARPHVTRLHTFAAGLPGAPDLAFARQVADDLDTVHHQVVVTPDELLTALPAVIYHLESFPGRVAGHHAPFAQHRAPARGPQRQRPRPGRLCPVPRSGCGRVCDGHPRRPQAAARGRAHREVEPALGIGRRAA